MVLALRVKRMCPPPGWLKVIRVVPYWEECPGCGKRYAPAMTRQHVRQRTARGSTYCSIRCCRSFREKGASAGQQRSRRQEKTLAAEMGGVRVPASGALPGLDGDVRNDEWLVECKTTLNKSYSVTRREWDKISGEAARAFRKPAMQIDIDGAELVVIRKVDFLEGIE